MAAKKKVTKTPKKPATVQLDAADPKLKPIEQDVIKAHQEFKDAEKVLNLFLATNEPVMREYFALIEEHNTKLQNADKIIRAADIGYGEWKRSERIKYDPEGLYALIGRAKFLEIGGVESTVKVHDIDSEKIELALAKKLIAESEDFKKTTSAYHAPKPK
jgi:hypothetical protein